MLNRAARECGGTPVAELPEKPIPWGDEYLPGLGVFFRGSLKGEETLLALRTGSSWAHHHDDDGSIQLFAFGRMLIGDAGFSGCAAGKDKFSDTGHSRWTLPEPHIHNYFWRCNRGWPTRLALGETLPEAVIFTPANFTLTEEEALPLPRQLRHFRKVVRLAADGFLVVDRNEQPVESCCHFHLGTVAVQQDGRGSVTAEFGDDVRLRLTPLTPGVTCERLPDIAGSCEDDSMTTAHIRYTVPERVSCAAFLIRFGTGPEVEQLPAIPPESCEVPID